VLLLPLLVLLGAGFLELVGVARDVLVAHEAARAGARAAATSTSDTVVEETVRAAAPEIEPRVSVSPRRRTEGDLAVVRVTVERRIGPVRHTVSARAVAVVEPVAGRTRPAAGP
jgi:Flp pilus assembly protein TadG